jgi:hypothetical protein
MAANTTLESYEIDDDLFRETYDSKWSSTATGDRVPVSFKISLQQPM